MTTDPRPWWVLLRDTIAPPLPAPEPPFDTRRAPSHGIPVTQPAALDPDPRAPTPRADCVPLASTPLRDARRDLDTDPCDQRALEPSPYRDDHTARCARRLFDLHN